MDVEEGSCRSLYDLRGHGSLQALQDEFTYQLDILTNACGPKAQLSAGEQLLSLLTSSPLVEAFDTVCTSLTMTKLSEKLKNPHCPLETAQVILFLSLTLLDAAAKQSAVCGELHCFSPAFLEAVVSLKLPIERGDQSSSGPGRMRRKYATFPGSTRPGHEQHVSTTWESSATRQRVWDSLLHHCGLSPVSTQDYSSLRQLQVIFMNRYFYLLLDRLAHQTSPNQGSGGEQKSREQKGQQIKRLIGTTLRLLSQPLAESGQSVWSHLYEDLKRGLEQWRTDFNSRALAGWVYLLIGLVDCLSYLGTQLAVPHESPPLGDIWKDMLLTTEATVLPLFQHTLQEIPQRNDVHTSWLFTSLFSEVEVKDERVDLLGLATSALWKALLSLLLHRSSKRRTVVVVVGSHEVRYLQDLLHLLLLAYNANKTDDRASLSSKHTKHLVDMASSVASLLAFLLPTCPANVQRQALLHDASHSCESSLPLRPLTSLLANPWKAFNARLSSVNSEMKYLDHLVIGLRQTCESFLADLVSTDSAFDSAQRRKIENEVVRGSDGRASVSSADEEELPSAVLEEIILAAHTVLALTSCLFMGSSSTSSPSLKKARAHERVIQHVRIKLPRESFWVCIRVLKAYIRLQEQLGLSMEDVLPFLNALRLLSAYDSCPSDSSQLRDQVDVDSLLLDLLDDEQQALSQSRLSKRTHSTGSSSTHGSDEGDGERDVGASIIQTNNSDLERHHSQDSHPDSTSGRSDGINQLKVYGRMDSKPLRKKDSQGNFSRGSTSPIRSRSASLPSSPLSRASSGSCARSPLIEHLSSPAQHSSPAKSSWRLKRKFSHTS